MTTLEQAQKLAEERYPDEPIDYNYGGVNIADGLNFNSCQEAKRQLFIEGYLSDRWIPVTPETMPENQQIVMVWIEERKMAFQACYKDGNWSDGYGYIELSNKEIKYWQPLPSPPKH